MRNLTAGQATACENSQLRRCRCRCGGMLHGAARGDIRLLAPGDPHAVDGLELPPEGLQMPLPGIPAPPPARLPSDPGPDGMVVLFRGVHSAENRLGPAEAVYAQGGKVR